MKKDPAWQSQESSVRNFIDRMFSMWGSRDPEKIIPFYDPDGEFIGPEGNRCQGCDEIRAMLEQIYQLFPAPTQLSVSAEKIHFLKDDIAVADCLWTQSGGPPGTPKSGHALLILAKEENEWLTVYHRALIPHSLRPDS